MWVLSKIWWLAVLPSSTLWAIIFEGYFVHGDLFSVAKVLYIFQWLFLKCSKAGCSGYVQRHIFKQALSISCRNLRFLLLRRCGLLWAASQAHHWWSLLRMGFRGYWSQTTPSLWSPLLSITSLEGTVTWHRWEGSSTAKATALALPSVRPSNTIETTYEWWKTIQALS